MEKVINISGQDVRFKATAALPLHFATHFNEDVLASAFEMKKNRGENTLLMYRMVWTMAYCANKEIKPLEQWLEDFDSFPIYAVYAQLSDMFWSSIKGVVPKN
ncbi:MAG TPA: hypothetical protein PKB13_08395 [Clostridia bacterium]|nr:hypothetical protein [Clostridia bacterium]